MSNLSLSQRILVGRRINGIARKPTFPEIRRPNHLLKLRKNSVPHESEASWCSEFEAQNYENNQTLESTQFDFKQMKIPITQELRSSPIIQPLLKNGWWPCLKTCRFFFPRLVAEFYVNKVPTVQGTFHSTVNGHRLLLSAQTIQTLLHLPEDDHLQHEISFATNDQPDEPSLKHMFSCLSDISTTRIIQTPTGNFRSAELKPSLRALFHLLRYSMGLTENEDTVTPHITRLLYHFSLMNTRISFSKWFINYISHSPMTNLQNANIIECSFATQLTEIFEFMGFSSVNEPIRVLSQPNHVFGASEIKIAARVPTHTQEQLIVNISSSESESHSDPSNTVPEYQPYYPLISNEFLNPPELTTVTTAIQQSISVPPPSSNIPNPAFLKLQQIVPRSIIETSYQLSTKFQNLKLAASHIHALANEIPLQLSLLKLIVHPNIVNHFLVKFISINKSLDTNVSLMKTHKHNFLNLVQFGKQYAEKHAWLTSRTQFQYDDDMELKVNELAQELFELSVCFIGLDKAITEVGESIFHLVLEANSLSEQMNQLIYP